MTRSIFPSLVVFLNPDAQASRMRTSLLSFVLCQILVMGGWRVAAAQIPGDEMERGSRSFRASYLSATFEELKPVLNEWRDYHDFKSLLKIMTEDATYYPVDGGLLLHKKEIEDSLALRLPRVQGYYSSVTDYSASGGLAYFLGRFSYRLTDAVGKSRELNGSFVMVLFLDGRNWRVRSYVERREDAG